MVLEYFAALCTAAQGTYSKNRREPIKKKKSVGIDRTHQCDHKTTIFCHYSVNSGKVGGRGCEMHQANGEVS